MIAPVLVAAFAVAAAPFVPDASLERAQVPDGFKWRLEPLFANDEAFARGLESAIADREKLSLFRGKLGDPAQLKACLELYFRTRLSTNRLTMYANLRQATDQKSASAQTLFDRSQQAMNDLIAGAGFIRQEVLALDQPALAEAYRREPGLEALRPWIDEVRRRRTRLLSPDSERVLALAGDNLWAEIDLNELPSPHEKTFQALIADLPLPKVTDEAGKEVQLALANYSKLRASPDRKVRAQAMEGLFAALRQHQHVAAAALAGQVGFNVFLARARGYPTALEAYLDKDGIDPAVYHNLVGTVRANLAPLHRYVALRKRVMGLPQLRLFDLYPPLVASVKKEVPFSEARRIVPEALAPLGKSYLAVLKEGLDPKNGWLDLYPHKDKESGAFSASAFGVHPFVKMNYLDDLDAVSTLAHEYGHALHSHLSMTRQPYVTSSYVPFVAEVASTFNEKLLSDWLLAHAKGRDERLYLLVDLAETIRTTIFRQALFAEFELAAHTAAEAGTPLTSDLLNRTYKDLLAAYYGPDLTLGENDEVEWSYIPHLYYKYYLFSYATGLSAGIALAERVQKGGAPARDAYLRMLESGSSKPPVALLRDAGADLTKPDAIEAAAKLFDRTLSQIEELLAAPAGTPKR